MANNTDLNTTRLPRMNHHDLVNSGFWVGQIFMLIATVMGVFLAAQTGLRQAIEFDSITDKQNNYFLRRSLHDELVDNTKAIQEYAVMVAKTQPYDLTKYHPQIEKFVWETMRYSAVTLETPSEILREARHFYSKSNDIIHKMELRFYSPTHGGKLLMALVLHMNTAVLPSLAKNVDKLKKELEVLDVDLD